MLPTRPKKRKGEVAMACAVRRHSGLTDILAWVGKASCIDDDVRSSFSEGDAAKLLQELAVVAKVDPLHDRRIHAERCRMDEYE